tara:strand:- start:253 stop:828 length:576 start_codon:yes stop_codon:yes gene_type:complete
MKVETTEVLLLMGPPGSGKGTQAAQLCSSRHLKKISTGDILRHNVKAGTELGRQAKQVMDVGELVSDNLMVSMVEEELAKISPLRVLLDGFPRTPGQADALKNTLFKYNVSIDAVFSLDVDDQELISRLLRRASEEGRSDDSEEVIAERMRIYRRDTEPLMAYYRSQGNLHEIDGNGGMDQVFSRIEALLS